MKIPRHLKHTPILEVPNYGLIDGPYIPCETDIKGLSIGIAHWGNPEWTDISAKVWRHTGKKWSRQAEELPIHRVIDLASLVCIAMNYSLYDKPLPTADDSFKVIEVEKSDINFMKKEIINKKEYLEISLTRLALELEKLGYCSVKEKKTE